MLLDKILRRSMENKAKKNYKKTIMKVLGIILAIIILCYMIKEFIENWNAIEPYLSNMNVVPFILSVIIYAVAFLSVGYNWSYLLWKMDPAGDKIEYLNIHMTSALARYIPGGIWNIVGKAVMCTKVGAEKSTTTVSMILEYVFQIISSGMFLLFFIPLLLSNNFNTLYLILFIIAVIIIMIVLPYGVRLGIKIIAKVFKEDSSKIQLKKSYIYNVLGRFILSWLITGIGLIVLVLAFSKIKVLQGILLVLSYPISWVVGFISPSPNGMGIREAVLGYFLRLIKGGYSYELILLLTLSTRIWTILGEIVAFVGFKIVYIIRKKRKKLNEG